MIGVGEDGLPRSSQWETYSGDMNARLARCLVYGSGKNNQKSTLQESPSATDVPAFGASPMAYWSHMYADGPYQWHDEPPVMPAASAALSSVVNVLGRGFSCLFYALQIDGQCFAAPRGSDADNPSMREALSGNEREGWMQARDTERRNIESVIESVPEDTLSTWNAVKGRAREVVSLVEVCKKKYLDGVFEKYKVRWAFDGRMQKHHNATTDHPLDTFAPTVRHATHKLLVANATQRGAADTTLSSKAYLIKTAAEVLPKPLSEYPSYATPSDGNLHKHYEAAVRDRAQSQQLYPELCKSYPSKVGKIVYPMPACRADCSYVVGILTRCLTYPTPELDAAADRCLAYMAQTADLGVTYSQRAPNPELHAYVDSDWQVDCSTSGWCIFYGGAVVSYGSKRQTCIALSSTEAEIMAASQAACEILYIRGLLDEMGVDMSAPTTLYVDNSGAVELSKDLKSCQRSRHIERRFLKLRELVASGQIVVKHCPTEDNRADLMTKSLPFDAFSRHATAIMGFTKGNQTIVPHLRQRTFDVEAAYLKGKFEAHEIHHVRPPVGYRTFIRGNVPMVWRLKAPLYGEADAGRIWNRTLIQQLVGVQNFSQSKYDPCYFWKLLSDGSRIDIVMYVDDGYVVDAFSSAADAELEALHAAFTIEVKPARFFLGNNVTIMTPDPAKSVELAARTR